MLCATLRELNNILMPFALITCPPAHAVTVLRMGYGKLHYRGARHSCMYDVFSCGAAVQGAEVTPVQDAGAAGGQH